MSLFVREVVHGHISKLEVTCQNVPLLSGIDIDIIMFECRESEAALSNEMMDQRWMNAESLCKHVVLSNYLDADQHVDIDDCALHRQLTT